MISTSDIDTADLLTWGNAIKPIAELAMTDDAPINAGDQQCRWCPISATCNVQAEHHMMAVSQKFDSLEPPNTVDHLTHAQLSYIVTQTKPVTGWLNRVNKHVYNLMLQGETIPGLKLVKKRSIRKWINEFEVENNIDELDLDPERFHTTKLISPTQAEKLLGKKRFADEFSHVVEKSPSKPTVVADSDKRPSLDPTDILGFEDISKT